jgi:hypothetical protein
MHSITMVPPAARTERIKPSFKSRKQGLIHCRPRYFFLFAAAFAFVACCDVMSACFFLFESLFFDCFCDACFCTDFGDLSPMVECLLLIRLTFGMFVSPRALVFIFEETSP